MPIYFQAVKEVSAAKSGVLTIPLIIGLAISVVVSGTATSIVGYYTPFMFFTSILTLLAAGLPTTIEVNERLASLICYQALLGFSAEIGLQAPQVAAQTNSLSTRRTYGYSRCAIHARPRTCHFRLRCSDALYYQADNRSCQVCIKPEFNSSRNYGSVRFEAAYRGEKPPRCAPWIR
jgi:hypothetical protein